MPKAAKAKCPGKSQSKKGKAANNAESTPSTSSDMGNKSKASADSLATETAREKAKSTNENRVSNGDASANVAKDGDTNTRGEKATTSKEGESTNDSGDASPPKKKRRINSWLNKPHYNEEVKEDEKGNTVTSYDLDDYTSVTEIVTPGGDKSIFRWRNEPQERMEAPNCDDDEILDLKENMKDYPMLKKVTNPVRYEETAIIVYSEDMIKMAKNQPSLSVDRTFHLGPCLVTMMVFRNENLKNRDSTANKKKPPPLFVGPTLLHFDYDEEAYKVFFRHVQKQLQLPVTAPDSPVKGKGKGKRPRKKYRPFPDNHIYNAMESVFGTTLKLCNGHMSPGAIRKQMRDLYFKPWESVTDVVRKWEFYFHECQSMFLSGGLSRELTDEAKLGMRALGWDMEDRELIRNHEKEVYQDFLGLRPRLE